MSSSAPTTVRRGGEHRLRLVLPARRVQAGANGLGELVIVGVAAAIANAVFNATGKRIRDLPITLDTLL
ncbi:MAG TPA: hypothetical protein VGD73_10535 [Pseudonocardia sp.]|jgi:xanthine dehydrogenase YagR molybdenum-binding subunit|uniref:hypothetical protein n=1 Tax=Pseudonocardia sp. TaxID=60912 RepID=UPI002EDB490F